MAVMRMKVATRYQQTNAGSAVRSLALVLLWVVGYAAGRPVDCTGKVGDESVGSSRLPATTVHDGEAFVKALHPQDTAGMRRLLGGGGRDDPQVQSVLDKCAALHKAGGGRCPQLARYIADCIKAHGRRCLRCTFSRINHVDNTQSKCTAVRNPRRFTIKDGSPVCKPGLQPGASPDGAVECPAGTAKRNPGNYRCPPCTGPGYQPLTGQTRCLFCLGNRTINAARTTCSAATPAPTQSPSAAPVAVPTGAPTDTPTNAPTAAPIDAPTEGRTKAPTVAPTGAPTAMPTNAPTDAPTGAPTNGPTDAPTTTPTTTPTNAPTDTPTNAPIALPTDAPTEAPTDAPTGAPTAAPTDAPTEAPTDAPTTAPTAGTCPPSPGPGTVAQGGACSPACDDAGKTQCAGINNAYCTQAGICDTSVCFPADAVVTLWDDETDQGKRTALADTTPGDLAQVVNEDGSLGWSHLYLHPHFRTSGTFQFVHIATASGTAIRMSEDHYAYVSEFPSSPFAARAAVPAGFVTAGSYIWRAVGDDAVTSDLVTEVKTVNGTGLINPFTLQGNIVVDGVAASCYSTMLGSEAAMHNFTSIGRLLYRLLPSLFRFVHARRIADPISMAIGRAMRKGLSDGAHPAARWTAQMLTGQRTGISGVPGSVSGAINICAASRR